ncbi:hypothetical protein SO802_026776 [Lithocarpus litseifolius]|uniref:Multiprotein bridging factor 1 N-terminal domain-containing protein n=1 Tax=Lithocarpus litseifolius TaxID=425828 RepID=A0AAW2C0S9_9ROSI
MESLGGGGERVHGETCRASRAVRGDGGVHGQGLGGGGERGAQPSLRGVQEHDRRSAVNQALRIGAAVQIVKKAEAGLNKKAATVVNVKKLDEAAEPVALDRVSTEVKQLIQKAAPVS